MVDDDLPVEIMFVHADDQMPVLDDAKQWIVVRFVKSDRQMVAEAAAQLTG